MNPTAEKLLFAFIGVILGYMAQQYRAARSEQAAIINEHIKDLEKFAEAAQIYWLKKPADADEELMLSAKVRSAHAVAMRPYDDLVKLCDHHGSEYQRRISDLYRCATGGDYEAQLRGIDPIRAIDTITTAAEVITLLRNVRADLISLRRLVKWICM